MTAPRTSFLIPVWNRESTLEQALSGVLAQTDPDLEVVIADDGSTDRSVEIAASTGDPRVRVLRLAHRGIVDALNAGLAACRGRYIARMDADDRVAPHRLARQIPRLEADPGLAVIDSQIGVFRDEGEVPEGMRRYADWLNAVITPDDFDREILIEAPIAHPAATIRRDVLVALGGYRDGPYPEDYDLWLRIHAAGHRLAKVPEVLVWMRDRDDRLTRTHPRYGKEALRNARRGWLRATVLACPRTLVVIGAGKEGKSWLKWLQSEGHHVRAALDISPRRIGGARAGVPVLPPSALGALDVEIGLVAAGARGAREEIRAQIARERPAWREGRDWWALR